MKKLILASLILLIGCSQAFALIVTDNVDKDKFQYLVAYKFATGDLGTSVTLADIPINTFSSSDTARYYPFFYTIPRDAKLVGISVAGATGCQAGAATFDVTINGSITGVQTVIETFSRSAVGNNGSSGTFYAYMNQDRTEDASSKGFKLVQDSLFYDSNRPWGRATPIQAGNRIGVQVTTSSNFSLTTNDYVIMVYVLE